MDNDHNVHRSRSGQVTYVDNGYNVHRSRSGQVTRLNNDYDVHRSRSGQVTYVDNGYDVHRLRSGQVTRVDNDYNVHNRVTCGQAVWLISCLLVGASPKNQSLPRYSPPLAFTSSMTYNYHSTHHLAHSSSDALTIDLTTLTFGAHHRHSASGAFSTHPWRATHIGSTKAVQIHRI